MDFLTFLRDKVKPSISFLSCLTQYKNENIIYLDANDLYGYAMSKFLQTSEFEWIDSKDFDSNKYSRNCSEGFVLEVDLKYSKELRELNNGYPLAMYRANHNG